MGARQIPLCLDITQAESCPLPLFSNFPRQPGFASSGEGGGTKATQFVWAVLVLGVATAVHSLPPARGQPAVHTRSRTACWSRVRVKGSLSSKHWGCRLRSSTAATDWRCRQRGRWPLRAHLPHCCKSLPPAEATRLGFKGPMFLFSPHFLLSGTRI